MVLTIVHVYMYIYTCSCDKVLSVLPITHGFSSPVTAIYSAKVESVNVMNNPCPLYSTITVHTPGLMRIKKRCGTVFSFLACGTHYGRNDE